MDYLKSFKLTDSEANVLFSLEYLITEMDISISSSEEYKNEKENWLNSWEKMITKQGFSLAFKDSKKELIANLSQLDEIKKKIILLEAFLFRPYFNLNIRATTGFHKGEQRKKTFTEKSYKGMENFVNNIARELLDNTYFLKESKNEFEVLLSDLPNDKIFSLKKNTFLTIASAAVIAITGGMAAPVLGTIIGGVMGLSGAAATSAGLALLGGGAIAAGGGGMLAGTVVIVGGGALLGGTAGSIIGKTLIENNSLILVQLSKLITIIKVIVPLEQKEEFISNCLEDLKKLRKELSTEIKNMDGKDSKHKSYRYINEAIKYLQSYEEEIL